MHAFGGRLDLAAVRIPPNQLYRQVNAMHDADLRADWEVRPERDLAGR